MDMKRVCIDTCCIKRIYKYLIVFFLATSCVGQGVNINDKSSHNAQAAEIQRKEATKLEPAGMKRKGYVPDEILVKFKDGTKKEAIEGIQRELHLKTIRVISGSNLYLMKIPGGSSLQQIMESLRKYEEVKYSEPNYVRSIR